jgi:hypothetical protein
MMPNTLVYTPFYQSTYTPSYSSLDSTGVPSAFLSVVFLILHTSHPSHRLCLLLLYIMAKTMREALVSPGPVIKIHDTPIPTPGPMQVLTKVAISGSNPKDW